AAGESSRLTAENTFTDSVVTINLSGGDVGSSTTDRITSHNGSTSALSLTFSGIGQASKTTQLKEGSTVIASTTAGSSGNWTITLSSVGTTLSDGTHSIVAHQTSGSFTDSSPLAVTIDTVAPTLSQSINAVTGTNGWYNSTGAAVITYVATDTG